MQLADLFVLDTGDEQIGVVEVTTTSRERESLTQSKRLDRIGATPIFSGLGPCIQMGKCGPAICNFDCPRHPLSAGGRCHSGWP